MHTIFFLFSFLPMRCASCLWYKGGYVSGVPDYMVALFEKTMGARCVREGGGGERGEEQERCEVKDHVWRVLGA